MNLSPHITEQLLHEHQRDLLREGEKRRMRAAALAGMEADPQPPAIEHRRLQPQPAADCRPA